MCLRLLLLFFRKLCLVNEFVCFGELIVANLWKGGGLGGYSDPVREIFPSFSAG